jgi:hypothetical protein
MFAPTIRATTLGHVLATNDQTVFLEKLVMVLAQRCFSTAAPTLQRTISIASSVTQKKTGGVSCDPHLNSTAPIQQSIA